VGHKSHANSHKPTTTSLAIHGVLVQVYSAFFSPWCLCNSFQLPSHSSSSLYCVPPAVTHLCLLQRRLSSCSWAGHPTQLLSPYCHPSQFAGGALLTEPQAGSGLLWSKANEASCLLPLARAEFVHLPSPLQILRPNWALRKLQSKCGS